MNLLTTKQAAEHLGVSARTVDRLIASKRLRAVNISSGAKRPTWRIHYCDLLAFAHGAPAATPQASPAQRVQPRRTRRRDIPNLV